MNRTFLDLYQNELQHLRQTAAEFAREQPKIAGRLMLDKEVTETCPDPYVERLLEGFAYLAARVQTKIEAEFPRFTQSLLESVYPHYLCPTPSMAVVRVDPNPQAPGTPDGFLFPRDSVLHGTSSASDTPCEFRTAHDVRIWPLRVIAGNYMTRDMARFQLPDSLKRKAAIRIGLQTNGAVKLNTLELDRLVVFARGDDQISVSILEQIFAHGTHVVIRTGKGSGNVCHVLPGATIQRVGFSDTEALLPFAPRGFEGYRLLQEYFAIPQRFQFFELTGLRDALAKCDCEQVDILILLKEAVPRLENEVNEKSFQLHCTPAINLFPRHVDPISLEDRFSEFHAVADRSRPLDYEIYQIKEVMALGATSDTRQAFRPFYLARDTDSESAAYFNVHRVPRVLSAKEKQTGGVSGYKGSEVFLSLVDRWAAPYRTDLRDLCLKAMCTNRHLPIQLVKSQGRPHFKPDQFIPDSSIWCEIGPTDPRPAHPDGEIAWRVISHLSLNYLSLADPKGSDDGPGAAGLRELLRLYGRERDSTFQKQIAGIRSVVSQPITRRIEAPGALSFGRGLEVAIEFDEDAFVGTGIFVLGSVLEQFFARYVSLNSFTETVIKSHQRGEIIRWKARPGKRHTI